jgi:DNA-binding LacI/PurR family transcriptional regulator
MRAKGPAAGGGFVRATQSWPVVVILAPDYQHWRTLSREELGLFANRLFSELHQFNVHIELALTSSQDILSRQFCVGRSEVFDRINHLGDRFLGTMFVSYLQNLPDMDHWIRWMCQFKKPVVWFDYDNQGQDIDRRTVGRKNFFRLYHDERAAVRMALRKLCDRGHRRIGVPLMGHYRTEKWHVRRQRMIAEEAARLPGRCRLVFSDLDEPLWTAESGLYREAVVLMHAEQFYNTLRRQAPGLSASTAERRMRKHGAEALPSLRTLVSRKRNISAILAMNQFVGINCYHWLTLAGVQVPDNMSIISFDNYLSVSHYPISTVDLGLQNLGYLGAHLFVGDLPVKTDRLGNVASTPEFIDRGSLGPRTASRRNVFLPKPGPR